MILAAFLAAFLAAASFASAATVPWTPDFDQALARSRRDGKAVLVAFEAPWCYSCYYMQKHVLSGEAFAQAARAVEPVMLDVDSGPGGALKQRYSVTFLPTFLVIEADGRERGRIVGEQTEADFLDKLGGLLAQVAVSPAEERRYALREKLKAGQPSALEELLKSPATCETPEDVEQGFAALKSLPGARREAALRAEAAALEKLAADKLFVPAPKRCADFRTGVEALADVYKELRRSQAATAGYDPRAVLARAEKLLEDDDVQVGEDRNHDDNMRLFLEKLGDDAKISAFYGKLLEAYPSDYVYPFRLAKYLKEKGRAAEALPFAQKAEGLAYGDNRLHVVELHAQILSALGRADQAKKLLELNAKAAARFSSEKADYLKRLEKTLSGAAEERRRR